jgi:hypothetical protein
MNMRHVIQFPLNPRQRRKVAAPSVLKSNLSVEGHIIDGAKQTPIVILGECRPFDDRGCLSDSHFKRKAKLLEHRSH